MSVADGDLVAVGCGDGWRVGLRVTSNVGLWVGRPRVGFHVSDGRGVCSVGRGEWSVGRCVGFGVIVGRGVWSVGRGVWSVGRGVWSLDVEGVPDRLGVAWSSSPLDDDDLPLDDLPPDDLPPPDFDDFLDAAVLSSPSSLLSLLDLSPLLLPKDCASARANERQREGLEPRGDEADACGGVFAARRLSDSARWRQLTLLSLLLLLLDFFAIGAGAGALTASDGRTTWPGGVGFGEAMISASVGLPVETIETGACVGSGSAAATKCAASAARSAACASPPLRPPKRPCALTAATPTSMSPATTAAPTVRREALRGVTATAGASASKSSATVGRALGVVAP